MCSTVILLTDRLITWARMIFVISIAMISFWVESTATGDSESEALPWMERYLAISEVGEALAEVGPLGVEDEPLSLLDS